MSPNAAISGRTHLGTFFSNHGIKPSDLNFLVGHKAMQMGQSLTPELFLQIQRLSVLMPDFSESSVHSLLLAISSRFPLKRSTLKLGRDQLIENRGSVALLKSLFGVKSNQALSLNQVRVASKYFPSWIALVLICVVILRKVYRFWRLNFVAVYRIQRVSFYEWTKRNLTS